MGDDERGGGLYLDFDCNVTVIGSTFASGYYGAKVKR